MRHQLGRKNAQYCNIRSPSWRLSRRPARRCRKDSRIPGSYRWRQQNAHPPPDPRSGGVLMPQRVPFRRGRGLLSLLALLVSSPLVLCEAGPAQPPARTVYITQTGACPEAQAPAVPLALPAGAVCMNFHDALADQAITRMILAESVELTADAWAHNSVNRWYSVALDRNVEITTLNLEFTLDFNFLADAVVISENQAVAFRNMSVENSRRGAGLGIDFFVGAENSTLLMVDVVRWRHVCTATTDAIKVHMSYPRAPLVAGAQNVTSVDTFCWRGACFGEGSGGNVHYVDFAMVVVPGMSESTTYLPGYTLVIRNTTRVCNSLVPDSCLQTQSRDQCLVYYTDLYIRSLEGGRRSSNKTAIIGGVLAAAAALALAAIAAVVLAQRRRRRRQRDEAATKVLVRFGPLEDMVMSNKQHGWKVTHHANARHEAGGGTSSLSDKIELGVLLGAGSFGRVYRGRWQGKEVAVKVMQHDARTANKIANEAYDVITWTHTSDTSNSRPPGKLRGTRSDARATASDAAAAAAGAPLGAARRSMDALHSISGGAPTSNGGGGGGGAAAPAARRLAQALKHSGSSATASPTSLQASVALMQAANELLGPGPAAQHSGSSNAHTGQLSSGGLAAHSGAAPAAPQPQPPPPAAAAAAGGSSGAPAPGTPALIPMVPAQPRAGNSGGGGGGGDFAGRPVTCYVPIGSGVAAPAGGGGGAGDDEEAQLALSNGGGGGRGALSASQALPQLSEQMPVILPAGGGLMTLPGVPAGSESDRDSDATGPDAEAQTWLIVEYCDTGTLADAVRNGKLGARGAPDMAKVLVRLRDVASGLAYLHSRNVLHGDLKAANVLLASSTAAPFGLIAKVADFGLSRMLKVGQTHRSTRTVGTVTHMPPELLRLGKLSPAGDVYAFGIIMWECWTGQAAFEKQHYGEVFERVVLRDERPPLPPNMPEAYALLMTRCWQADPMSRPGFDTVLRLINLMIEDMLTPEEGSAALATPALGVPPGGARGGCGGAAAGAPPPRDGSQFIQDL
ncbi:MAG: hypothetical protein J3K34DRAFT_524069 [Monoraphidium minutum]|nr:MAG: hypothetical protein J3K34DRAFT_524069 [Monoraphidium minutum]